MKRLVSVALALGAAACADPITAPVRPVAPSATVNQLSAGAVIPDEYIVRFRDDVQDVHGLAKELAAANGGTVRYTYTTAVKGFAGHFSAQAASALAHNPHVAYVEADQVVRADGAGGTESPTPSWGLDRIDQHALPDDNSYTYPDDGSSATAYIIDTGMNPTLSDFGGRASIGVDEIGDGQNGIDCNGHGTHVSGTVGGAKYGVAKGVKLVAVRVLDCSGSGSDAGVAAGVDWVAAHHAPNAVANMSLGGGLSSTLDAAVQGAISAGVTFAIAAGNGNALGIAQSACNSSPADVAAAITVSATDNTDTKASWANYGTCVDIFAPGVNITSDWYTGGTNTISGTSMATPHVTGAAALYLDANPGASPATVASALTTNATPSVVKSAGSGSPNRLLYVGFIAGSGGGTTNSPPTAAFTSSCTNLSCSFTDGSSDQDGTVTGWSWNFGDGTTSSAQNPSHDYSSGTTYTVTLTVTDNGGATNSISHTVTVSAPASGGITLTATGGKVKGVESADLTWAGAATNVDVYRNGAMLKPSVSGTSYHDSIGKKGAGSYSYQVCPTGTAVGSTGCSNTATVTF